MTDRLAELGALQYAVENLSTAGTNPNRLGLAGYIHAAYTDYQAWAAANPGVNPNRLSAKGRLYGYFYDHASWSPLSLFASSEVGVWYDPSDLTTMFQDRAGTTPVTADGQTVGKILDKSGRGNHAVAPSDAARPLYKTDGTYHWLQFDGVDDSLSTAVFPIAALSGDCFVGMKPTAGNISAFLTNQTAAGYWAVMQSGSGSSPTGAVCGTPEYRVDGITLTSPTRNSLLSEVINQNSVLTTKNLVFGSSTSTGLSISGYTAFFYVGNIYSLIVRGALSTAQEITNTETWVAAKTGVTL